MNETYVRILRLCEANDMNITEMCRGCSIPRAVLTDFKMGRNKTLSATYLFRIAEFFSCTVEYLLTGRVAVADDHSLKVALFGGAENVSDEMWEEVKNYARFLMKEREAGER